MTTILKDRIYRLTSKATPLSYMLSARNTKRFPLMHWNGKVNRPLRYARNQKTPFEDEQDKNAILEPIIFLDGFLRVSKTNPVLQEFLSLHPGNGGVFMEVDTAKDAAKEVEYMNVEVDALIAAKEMDIKTKESIARTLLGANVDRMSTAELNRDILVYARNNPKDFLDSLDDPMLEIKDTASRSIKSGLIQFRNQKRDVYFNLPKNKKRMMTIPFNEEPMGAISAFFQTDEGIEIHDMLDKKLSE